MKKNTSLMKKDKMVYYIKRATGVFLLLVVLAVSLSIGGVYQFIGLALCAVSLVVYIAIEGKHWSALKNIHEQLNTKNEELHDQSTQLSDQVESLADLNARLELMISMTPGLLVENLDELEKVRIEGKAASRFDFCSGLMDKGLFLKRIHPSDFIQYFISYGKMADGTYSIGDEVREEIRLQLGSGEYVWTECFFSVLSTSEGIKRVVCTFNDIDEQKRQLTEHGNIIQSLSNQYSTLLIVDLAGDNYDVIKDERGLERRIPTKGAYTRLCKIFFGTRVVADDRVALLDQLEIAHIERHLSVDSPVMEVEYMRKQERDSAERWERVTMIEVAAEGDLSTLVMMGINDITKQKKEEISNRQIIQDAMLAATQANNAKSDFLSRMSHDIRTPLNAIIGMSVIARKNIDNYERIRDCLGKIDGASKHLLDLVNKVLDMSRIESGRVIIVTEEVDLHELISNIHIIVESLADEKSHTLIFNKDTLTHPFVVGDTSRIQQILTNLLSNAIKYTPKGGEIVFTVNELPGEPGSSVYEFMIEDNGVGMTPEFVSELYEPFSRVDDSRTSKIEGTGLGMAIVQNLILMMDGYINVESEVGAGTKFTVSLPLKHVEAGKGAEREKVEQRTEFPGRRILMVEDNELNMEIAVDLLEITGITVETAENGLIAFEKVVKTPENYYDLIFMDIQMPVMNGYEAAKAIRALKRDDAATLPIVAVTANAFAEDVQKTREAGMNDHIAKPISFAQLLGAMNTYIKTP
ncbi:MAG: response regulator [Lachnospiraceae bacterium]|jgi:signal transduction histidine kinase/CheY-like chemotaxis protein|nr:response regulator [Lachnospiraceae bacterium]